MPSDEAVAGSSRTVADGERAGDAGEQDPVDADVETRTAVGIRDPKRPSAADVAEHNLTHANYRDWCPTCCAAKGISEPHRKAADRKDQTIPGVSADYCFMCRDPSMEDKITENEDEVEYDEEKSKDKMTILTVKDIISRCLRLHWVPHKGVTGTPWIAKEVVADMELWGHTTCIFNLDQERAL